MLCDPHGGMDLRLAARIVLLHGTDEARDLRQVEPIRVETGAQVATRKSYVRTRHVDRRQRQLRCPELDISIFPRAAGRELERHPGGLVEDSSVDDLARTQVAIYVEAHRVDRTCYLRVKADRLRNREAGWDSMRKLRQRPDLAESERPDGHLEIERNSAGFNRALAHQRADLARNIQVLLLAEGREGQRDVEGRPDREIVNVEVDRVYGYRRTTALLVLVIDLAVLDRE